MGPKGRWKWCVEVYEGQEPEELPSATRGLEEGTARRAAVETTSVLQELWIEWVRSLEERDDLLVDGACVQGLG